MERFILDHTLIFVIEKEVKSFKIYSGLTGYANTRRNNPQFDFPFSEIAPQSTIFGLTSKELFNLNEYINLIF